jgi:hypothetical protein
MKNTMKNTLKSGSIALGLGLMLTTLCQAQQWSGEQDLGEISSALPLWRRYRARMSFRSFTRAGTTPCGLVGGTRMEAGAGSTFWGGQLFPGTCGKDPIPECEGFNETPVAIQIPNTNYLEVFYRAPDNTLRYRLRDPITYWGPEGNLGGNLSSDPSAAPTPGTAEIEVYYRGAGVVDGNVVDGHLMTQWGDINRWTYETPVTGVTLSGYYCDSYSPPADARQHTLRQWHTT